jgi:uncharacterized protein YdhG (YjbR/CyaY superfamily)
MEAFKDELKDFTTTKGSFHFTPEKPMPTALVKKIVKASVAENDARAVKKSR